MRVFNFAVLWVLLLFCGLSVQAQDRSSVELQLSAGARNKIIEATCSGGGQTTFGASLRYHLTPRTSVGPEVSFVRSCARQAFTFYHPQVSGMLQIAHDFTDGRFRPYVIGGAGFVRHHSQYASSQTKFEWAGGAGAKIFFTKRAFVAPEVQVGGRVAFFKYSVGVGIVLR